MQFFEYWHCTDRQLYTSDSSISLSMYIVVLGTRSLSRAASALRNHNIEPPLCDKLEIAESQCHHCTIATMLYLPSAPTLFRISSTVIRRERLFRNDRGTRDKDDPCQVLQKLTYNLIRVIEWISIGFYKTLIARSATKLDIVGLRYNYRCNTMNISSGKNWNTRLEADTFGVRIFFRSLSRLVQIAGVSFCLAEERRALRLFPLKRTFSSSCDEAPRQLRDHRL